ncbi:MAG: 2-dehydropantoate 2-reductase [Treponema sp.]|nr:2-dehydropantoate 2-reductase [Treponema sp.]
MNNYNIAIYGAGSMGTVLGAYLSRAGMAADLITRDKAHIEALKNAGAQIGGTASFSTPPFDGAGGRGLALLPSEMQKKYDVIFLLTKQLDNAAVATMLNNFLAGNGVVCTLQNGIPEPLLAETLGPGRTLGCMCAWGSVKTGPGMVELTSEPDSMSFGLGGLEDNHPMLPAVKTILEKMCHVDVEHNFIGVRWSKLLINAAFSGMSAVTGWNFGAVAANKKSRDRALYVIKECIEVCRAAGVRIEPVQGKDIVRLMYFNNPLQKIKASLILPIAIKKHRAITSSMLQDLDRGRPCEIDAINGVVSSWGKKYSVPTPANDWIIEMVHAIEKGQRKYGPHNL